MKRQLHGSFTILACSGLVGFLVTSCGADSLDAESQKLGTSKESLNKVESTTPAPKLPSVSEFRNSSPPSVPDDYVVTPGGYFHHSCVVDACGRRKKRRIRN